MSGHKYQEYFSLGIIREVVESYPNSAELFLEGGDCFNPFDDVLIFLQNEEQKRECYQLKMRNTNDVEQNKGKNNAGGKKKDTGNDIVTAKDLIGAASGTGAKHVFYLMKFFQVCNNGRLSFLGYGSSVWYDGLSVFGQYLVFLSSQSRT